MTRCAFLGFGEVNTPSEVIRRKCAAAEAALKDAGVTTVSVWPISDDYEEKDIKRALAALEGERFDSLVL
jgi:DNA-binding LacI/PurR family transcriptional regulator